MNDRSFIFLIVIKVLNIYVVFKKHVKEYEKTKGVLEQRKIESSGSGSSSRENTAPECSGLQLRVPARETNRSHKRVSTLLGNVKKMHHFDENDKRVVKRYKFYKICITFDRHACQRCIPLKIRISRRVRQQKQKLCVVVQVASFDDAFLLLRHTPKRCITCII